MTPFFADVTLDLAEAHDIAETPEPTRVVLVEAPQITRFPSLNVQDDRNSNAAASTSMTATAMTMSEDEGGTDQIIDNTVLLPARTLSPFSADPRQSMNGSSPLPDHSQPQSLYVINQHHNPQDDLQPMARVTSSSQGRILRPISSINSRLRRRQWPKDVSWTVAFCIFVPVSLLLPIWLARDPDSTSWIATSTSARLATLHTLLWGLAAAVLLSRLLYQTMGGGDGDDARHRASQLLLASAPISVSVYILLVVATHFFTPHARVYSIIPLWYLARDLYLFRRWKMSSTTPGGRQAFFQALTCMTLDILSRALRRQSFYRIISAIVVTQFLVIAWWRMALLAAIQSNNVLWIVLAAMGGKWATGTVARLLSLIACGGISNWFAEQSSLVADMNQLEQQQQQQNQEQQQNQQHHKIPEEEEITIEFSTVPKQPQPNHNVTNSSRSSSYDQDDGMMPEAYRMVDASAYRSVLQQDEGMDDDFDDEDDGGEDDAAMMYATSSRQQMMMGGPRRNLFGFRSRNTPQDHPMSTSHQQRSTVKELLVAGLTVSFGSVAKCGLLGGLAQFVWSQIRKIDHARATFGGLRGMTIGGGPDSDGDSSPREGIFRRVMLRINTTARDFVRSHSDLAMSYVAAYQTSYTRSAQDVAILVDESGVEPIIHDDISTHMSACVGGSVSGLIVIFTGAVLVHQRNRNAPAVSDSAIVLDMVLAFYFCYTLIFTVMEPLRASIKAVYVCFAQHPESLSQAFPLIYHRLTRMSQSNLH